MTFTITGELQLLVAAPKILLSMPGNIGVAGLVLEVCEKRTRLTSALKE